MQPQDDSAGRLRIRLLGKYRPGEDGAGREKHFPRNTPRRGNCDFSRELKARRPGIDICGHGVRPLVDKPGALGPSLYHMAIENCFGPHHWTEKLPAILESRRRVPEDNNTIATIVRLVNERHDTGRMAARNPRFIASRRLHRKVFTRLSYILEKFYVRGRHLLAR